MASIINRGTMLPPEMVSEIFNGVRGDSAIARRFRLTVALKWCSQWTVKRLSLANPKQR